MFKNLFGGTPNLEKLKHNNDFAGLAKALSHKETTVRRDVVTALGTLEKIESISLLRNALHDEDQDIQKTASDTLLRLCLDFLDHQRPSRDELRIISGALDELSTGMQLSNSAKQHLLSSLAHEKDNVVWGAAKVLGNLKEEQAIPALIKALQRKDSAAVSSVAEALGKLRAEEAIIPLAERLKPANVDPTAIVFALGEIGDKRAVEPLLELFDQARLPMDWIREVIIAFTKLGDSRAIEPVLTSLFLDDYPNEIRAMLKVMPTESKEILRRVIDPDRPRQRWLELLSDLGDDSAVQQMVKSLVGDDFQSRRETIKALKASGWTPTSNFEKAVEIVTTSWNADGLEEKLVVFGQEALEPVISALEHSDYSHTVWNALANAAATIGGESAVEPLAKILDHNNYLKREAAANALVRLGSVSVDALIKVLKTDSWQGHAEKIAAWALGEIGDKRALDALRSRLVKSNLQSEITKAIEKIEQNPTQTS